MQVVVRGVELGVADHLEDHILVLPVYREKMMGETHQDVLFETMMNACMGDDFDVDALLGELDTAFDNLAQ